MHLKARGEQATSETRALLRSMQSRLTVWMGASPAFEPASTDCRACRAQLYLIARTARSAGLLAYASLSMRIGEQLEPLFLSNGLPRSAVELLWQWSSASLHYLDLASNRIHAAKLVTLLSRSPSPGHYGVEERARLLQGLIDDPIRLARSVKRAGPCWLHRSSTQ